MTSRNRSRETDGSARRLPHHGLPGTQDESLPSPDGADAALVHIHDLAGRPRGTGFAADHHGTVITSHEAVDGLTRLVLRTADDRRLVVAAADVTPLPGLGLALVRAEGLDTAPLTVSVRDRIEAGTYVRIFAGCWREARVLGTTDVTYTATDRFHRLGDALELALGMSGRDALRLGGGAAGGPVVDVGTGAVLGVLGTALTSGHRDVGFAVPLRAASGPLADLLAENAETVPAYGADLNPAGVLALTAASARRDGPVASGRAGHAEPVVRDVPARELAAFAARTDGPAHVLGLVGPPGSGRTTALEALAARRSLRPRPAPTLRLRGADLCDDDASVADAVRRTLARAAREVATAEGAGPADPGDITPERLARLAGSAGRPLLILLDGPEEMPPALAQRLAEWTEGTTSWLEETGARLVVACREEYWERAGAEFPREVLHEPSAGEPAAVCGPGERPWTVDAGDLRPWGQGQGQERGALGLGFAWAGFVPPEPRPAEGAGCPGTVDAGCGALPPCVRLGDLRDDEAREARARYGIAEGTLSDGDGRHPLTLRLLSEVQAALQGVLSSVRVDRDAVLGAYLDLMCLRVANRLAGENGLHGTAVRRLAARVSGRVHEAARRSLGPGQGELDRESFAAVFPRGPAPARLGGGTGWADAVLAEGLFVPAGDGYRFAHEELADWIQGTHLDLDEALRVLVHDRHDPRDTPAVPHHRIGPVVEALLHLGRQYGVPQLALTLEELVNALDAEPHSWWAGRLLAGTLTRVPDATPYTEVLRLLADGIAERRGEGRPVPAGFGPAFWTALRLPAATRLDLLRRLLLADGAPHEPGPRHLDTVARLLAADPATVQPLLVRWFDDERPLPATPHATVATAAQALLHTHRHRGLDGLTEVLADSTHRRADELLAVLAEEEPSAVCRAVDRWARDERPARHTAAVTHGLRTAPHARTAADRTLLRHAALVLLTRPADGLLHGGALALLVQDPGSRDRHLPRALEHFAAGDPYLPPSAVAAALPTHPERVLDAFRVRLRGPDAGEALRRLLDATTPHLARRVAVLIGEAVADRPETAGHVAAYCDRRLDQGPAARGVLLPLVTGLLDGGPEPVRAALAGVLATDGAPASGSLRRELRDHLLAHEAEPAVLDALLRAAASQGGDGRRALVHRTALLLVRTPDGATRLDRALVDLARHLPGFAGRVTGWLADAPAEWAALIGPSAHRTIESLAGTRVPA
ncbi:trypsin-like peptidase domain-containing protein [Streptomyces sp. NPDC032940]|uniref:trypsin-like peptidase domain-containing protein n=1 Tax=Streptomyces sp. NPDC032940 TaxID=3155366 RepID=UPI0033E9F833